MTEAPKGPGPSMFAPTVDAALRAARNAEGAWPLMFHADYAWLGGERVVADVLITVDHGRIASVVPGVARPREATRLRGVTLPGLANAHSHAFQRALRGRTQRGGGSFWTWREDMYALAGSLTPDDTHRLALGTYREMLRAGITCVGEFDYVHHSEALIAAADEVGIRLTLLDACYLAGGFGEPPNAVQERFGDGDAERWAERVSAIKGARVGAAIHSVRAVPERADPARSSSGRRASRCTSTSASSAPRTRPASPPTASRPVQLLARARRARAALDRRPRHPPHRRRPRAAARDHDLHVPDDRARPRRRHRPPRRQPQPSAATATRSSTSSRRPARSSSTCAWPPSARPLHRAGAAATARPTTRASAGPRPAASSRARSPTSSPSAWTPRAWRPPSPRPCSNRSSSPPPRPTSTPS